MVECMNPALAISRQCRLLALPRSSVYRKPAEVDAEDLAIMALIDRHYLVRPYYGSRRMAAWLATQGHRVNRKRVQRLMRLLGLAAIYQRPNTSKPAEAHKIYPYLLRGLAIERVNQVWCSDVTYIPMAKGFLYLVVIMDWVSRAVLAWRVSNTLGADFCVEALEEALSRYGRPEIFNTDQGSQFTSDDFTGTLKRHGIMISMDGKGRCMDNIFVERLWRSPTISVTICAVDHSPPPARRHRRRPSASAAYASFFTLSKRKGLPHLSGSRRLRSSRFRTTTSYCGRGSREAGS
jgi:putative transposase